MRQLPGIILSARSIDDVDPQWRWLWDRLAVVWLPAFDPYLAVGPGGTSPVTVSSTNTTFFPGLEGEAELWRAQLSTPIQVSPSALSNGMTLVENSRTRVRGNRYGDLSFVGDGTSRAGTYINHGSGGWERLLEPPGAYDANSLTFGVNVPTVSIASITNGDQRYYLNGVAGTSRTTTFAPTWGTNTRLYVSSLDASLEAYQRFSVAALLIGPTRATEIGRLTDAMRTPAPFRWRRRRFYSIPSATIYQVSVSGSITPTSALVKKTKKILSGSVTPTGVVSKKTYKQLAGSITPVGTLLKRIPLVLSGSITMSGNVSKVTKKIFAGFITISGNLVKKTYKILDGSISLSGTLTRIKASLVVISGSITMSGVLSTLLIPASSLAAAFKQFWIRRRYHI